MESPKQEDEEQLFQQYILRFENPKRAEIQRIINIVSEVKKIAPEHIIYECVELFSEDEDLLLLLENLKPRELFLKQLEFQNLLDRAKQGEKQEPRKMVSEEKPCIVNSFNNKNNNNNNFGISNNTSPFHNFVTFQGVCESRRVDFSELVNSDPVPRFTEHFGNDQTLSFAKEKIANQLKVPPTQFIINNEAKHRIFTPTKITECPKKMTAVKLPDHQRSTQRTPLIYLMDTNVLKFLEVDAYELLTLWKKQGIMLFCTETVAEEFEKKFGRTPASCVYNTRLNSGYKWQFRTQLFGIPTTIHKNDWRDSKDAFIFLEAAFVQNRMKCPVYLVTCNMSFFTEANASDVANLANQWVGGSAQVVTPFGLISSQFGYLLETCKTCYHCNGYGHSKCHNRKSNYGPCQLCGSKYHDVMKCVVNYTSNPPQPPNTFLNTFSQPQPQAQPQAQQLLNQQQQTQRDYHTNKRPRSQN